MTKQYIEHNLKFIKADPFNISFLHFNKMNIKNILFSCTILFIPLTMVFYFFSRSTLAHNTNWRKVLKMFGNKQNSMEHWIGFALELNKSILYESQIYGVSHRWTVKMYDDFVIFLICVFRKIYARLTQNTY